MLNAKTMLGTMAVSSLVGNGVSKVLHNKDGSVNWKLIGIIGLSVALVAAMMGYRQERKQNGG